MAFTKVTYAGIDTSGTVTTQNLNVIGVVTATSFNGNLIGNVTGSVTGNVTGNVTGTATTASSLTGTPNITVGAINASSAVISGNVSVAGTITYEDTTNVDSIGVITARSGIHVTGGSIGIGTNNPTSKLQVIGSTDLTKLNLSGISSSISSTAVDVFVYDTRKDSDGGAWRKRTQNTSWYNETLNTATRGSRKDFPAVAVIVATTNTITIYDGDDPDMPMWMVFTDGYSTYLGMGVGGITAVTMFNGIMSHCGTYDLHVTNFISDKTNRYGDSGGITVNHKLPISGRNDTTAGNYNGPTTPYIANRTGNDVAMTVLPNAPIDAATGLPVPTIAVATAGGTSIIRDDGTVANITYTNFNVANFIHFTKDNKIAILTDSATGGARFYRIYEIPSSNLDGGAYNNMGSALRAYGGDAVAYNYPIRYFWYSNTIDTGNFYANALVYAKDGPVFGRNGRGIALISEGHSNLPGEIIPTLSTSAGMVCGISSSVNTGWMHGNIQGAWLSDTSTASVTGTELVTNGTFASGTTGWTAGSGATISVTSGVLRVTNTATNGRAISNTFSTIVGKRYVLTADGVSKTTSNYYMEVRGPEVSTTWASGTGVLYFTAVGTTTYVELYAIGSGVTYSEYDNVSVRIVEDDRSVNNKGLAVYGTITKTAVATGSNLVAYSGFSLSNYLVQPYNSALVAGTGSQCFMGWVYTSGLDGNLRYLFSVGRQDSNEQFRLGFSSSATYFDYGNASQYIQWSGNNIPSNTWTFVVAMVTAGKAGKVFVNGIELTSPSYSAAAPSTFATDTIYVTTIGTTHENHYGGGSSSSVWNGSISLVRYSLSVPSPTQIAKIYNDEKMLFQENSQCTLYGSSDAVTALAYDDSNSLLSVGTSSGRSDFRGLERINNTTTAVTTAISASNGLIAEQ